MWHVWYSGLGFLFWDPECLWCRCVWAHPPGLLCMSQRDVDISSVWLILLILDVCFLVRWITPLNSSVLSNNVAPQPTVGAWSLVALTSGMFLHSKVSLGVYQLMALESKRGCSGGIVCCWSCSLSSARGATCQIWPPPPSAALPLISAGFALVACPSWGKASTRVGCNMLL